MIMDHLADAKKTLETTHNLHKEGKLHRQVIARLVIMAIMVFIGLGLIIYEIVIDNIHWLLTVGIVIISTLFGLWMSRMYKMDWSEEEELIVAQRMDWTSAIILAVYFLLRLGMREVFIYFNTDGVTVFAAGFAVLFGVALGRFIGMLVIVRRTHEEGTASRI